MQFTQHRMMAALVVAHVSLVCACDGCSDPTTIAEAPVQKPASSLDCQVVASLGHSLGNAVAGQGGLLVAGPQGKAHYIGPATTETLTLDAKKIGGVYYHKDVFYLLDTGGNQVVSLDVQGKNIRHKNTFDVGTSPRLVAFSETSMRVVRRANGLPFVDVNLQSGQMVEVPRSPTVVADIEWHRGAFYEAWISQSKVGAVQVAAEPYRLHTTRSGLYAMHASSPVVTKVDDGAELTLAGPPLRLAGDLVALVSGSGKVQVIEDMSVVATHDVPAGANDLVVLRDGIAAVSSGSSGTIYLLPVAPGVKIDKDKVEVPFSVGRLYPRDGTLWVIGPRSGRVARCELN